MNVVQLFFFQVAWNPNLGSHRWLAVGGQAGLLRVIRVNQPPCDYADSAGARLFSRRSRRGGQGETTAEVEPTSATGKERTLDGDNRLRQQDCEGTGNECDAGDAAVR